MGQTEARAILFGTDQPAALVLQALRAELRLSDFDLSAVVGKSAQTVRRWRLTEGNIMPGEAASQIDDLRAIAVMLLRNGIDSATTKSFLLSRNAGLGRERPLDCLGAGPDALRRVEHVAQCFVAGIAPEPQAPPRLPSP